MSLTAATDVRTSGKRPIIRRYVVVNGQTVNPNRVIGILTRGATKGQIREYDPSVGSLRPLGLLVDDAKTGDAGGTVYARVQVDGLAVTRGVVTSSSSSLPGDPVYCDSAATTPADLESLNMDAEGFPVAVLLEQVNGTSWIIQMLSEDGALADAIAETEQADVTEYTADGAITLPTADNETVRLTGGSSAQMTLAAPGAARVGFRLHIYRSGGSGTHDVDFTDDGAGAVTYVFSASDAITLLAVSATEWRPI